MIKMEEVKHLEKDHSHIDAIDYMRTARRTNWFIGAAVVIKVIKSYFF